MLILECPIRLGECPKVAQLEQLRSPDGKVIKIITEVAGVWEEMARRLDFSEPEVSIISRDHGNSVKLACTNVFVQWLAGEHRQPVTWQTVVDCLRELDLNVAAENLNAILLH